MPGGSASCLWEPNLQQSSKSSRAASRGNIRSDLAAASASPTLRTPAHVIAIKAPSPRIATPMHAIMMETGKAALQHDVHEAHL